MLCSGFIVYDTLASTRHEVTAVLWWYRNVRFIWETQWRLRFFAITGWGHELLCQHDMIIMNDYLNNFISSWFWDFVPQVLCRLFHALGIMCCLTWACVLHRLGLPTHVQLSKMLCMMSCSGFIIYDTLASTRHEVTAVLWWYRNVRFIWETQWRLRFFAITGWGHELLCQHDMIIMNDYLNNFISSWFWDFVPQVLCRLFHALGIMCCLTWACVLHRLGLPTHVQLSKMLCMMLCSGFIISDTLASTRHEVTAVLWWYRNVRFIWETQWRLRFFAITGWGHELLCQHDMIIMNDYLNNFISSWFWDFVPQVLCRLFHALGIMCCLTWACVLHRLGLPTDVQLSKMLCMMLCSGFIIYDTLASTRHEVTAVLWWYRNVRFIWETQWRLRFFAITGWGHELLSQHDMIIMDNYLNNFISSWFWDLVL